MSRDEAVAAGPGQAISAEVAADEVLERVVDRADAESDLAAFCVVLKTGLTTPAPSLRRERRPLTVRLSPGGLRT